MLHGPWSSGLHVAWHTRCPHDSTPGSCASLLPPPHAGFLHAKSVSERPARAYGWNATPAVAGASVLPAVAGVAGVAGVAAVAGLAAAAPATVVAAAALAAPEVSDAVAGVAVVVAAFATAAAPAASACSCARGGISGEYIFRLRSYSETWSEQAPPTEGCQRVPALVGMRSGGQEEPQVQNVARECDSRTLVGHEQAR